MGSDRFYKLFVRDGEPGAAWVEVTQFLGFGFKKVANGVPIFSCTVYASSTLAALLTGNRIFRITTRQSVDGKVAFWSFGRATTGTGTPTDSASEAGAAADSWEIMTGRLAEPRKDEKTSSARRQVFDVTGYGFMASLDQMDYDGDRTLTGTAQQVISTGANSLLTTIGAARVVAGSLDAGPTISIKTRKDKLLRLLIDIARIGDAGTQYPYFIEVTHNASFVPVVSYLSSANALFEPANPFGPRDDGRILDDKTELQSFDVVKERDRLVNRVKVRYAGFGTGVAVAETSVVTDGAFPEVRERIARAPLIQNSTTATTFRNTILNTFKGTSEGLVRVEALLKRGELYTATGFDAVLGDQVGIERAGVEVAQGKFLGFEYTQAMQSLTITLGLPRSPFFENYYNLERAVQQALAGMGTSQTQSGSLKSQMYDALPATGIVAAGATTFDVDDVTGLDITLTAYDDFALEASIVYDTVGGEPATGIWFVEVFILRQDGSTLDIIRMPVHLPQGREWTLRLHFRSSYFQGLSGWTGIGGVRMNVKNDNSVNQTLSAANATLDAITTHVHGV